MTTFVVLGMHRTGTSLVSSILHALGVNMGDRMLGPREGNPYGHFEDLDFVDLNDSILSAAGGSWHHPPSEAAIIGAGEQFEEAISALVKRKSKSKDHWGFKDPRTALTIKLFEPFLVSPVYICTHREINDIMYSMLTRHEPVYTRRKPEWYLEYWKALARLYEQRISAFLDSKKGVVHIHFEDLIDRRKVSGPINALVDLVKPSPLRVREAFYQVRLRK